MIITSLLYLLIQHQWFYAIVVVISSSFSTFDFRLLHMKWLLLLVVVIVTLMVCESDFVLAVGSFASFWTLVGGRRRSLFIFSCNLLSHSYTTSLDYVHDEFLFVKVYQVWFHLCCSVNYHSLLPIWIDLHFCVDFLGQVLFPSLSISLFLFNPFFLENKIIGKRNTVNYLCSPK